MALTPINMRQAQPKRDALDRIAQLAQIAGSGVGIYSGIESGMTNSLQRKLAQEKADAEVAQAAIMNPLLADKAKADIAQTQATTSKTRAEMAALGGGGPVKALTSEQTDKFSGYENAVKQLHGLSQAYKENTDLVGPVKGRIAKLNPYDTKAQKLGALSDLAAQVIGKSLEGGKLTDQDVLRYRTMLPQPSDTPEVAEEKIQNLLAYVAERQASDIDTAKSANFNVKNISRLTPPQTGLTPPGKKSTLVPEAHADNKPPKPQVVKQNGHTYRLNPNTGKYE